MPRNPGHPTIQVVRMLQTHCVNGHEFTPENTAIIERPDRRGQFQRRCRKCAAIREAKRRENA